MGKSTADELAKPGDRGDRFVLSKQEDSLIRLAGRIGLDWGDLLRCLNIPFVVATPVEYLITLCPHCSVPDCCHLALQGRFPFYFTAKCAGSRDNNSFIHLLCSFTKLSEEKQIEDIESFVVQSKQAAAPFNTYPEYRAAIFPYHPNGGKRINQRAA